MDGGTDNYYIINLQSSVVFRESSNLFTGDILHSNVLDLEQVSTNEEFLDIHQSP